MSELQLALKKTNLSTMREKCLVLSSFFAQVPAPQDLLRKRSICRHIIIPAAVWKSASPPDSDRGASLPAGADSTCWKHSGRGPISPRRVFERTAEWLEAQLPTPAGLPPASPIYIPHSGGSKGQGDSISQKNSRAQLAAHGRHACPRCLWRDRDL